VPCCPLRYVIDLLMLCRCICANYCAFYCHISIVTWRKSKMAWSCCSVTGKSLIYCSSILLLNFLLTNHSSVVMAMASDIADIQLPQRVVRVIGISWRASNQNSSIMVMSHQMTECIMLKDIIFNAPCVLRVVRTDPLRFMARCHKRRLNQALSVFSLVQFFYYVIIYYGHFFVYC